MTNYPSHHDLTEMICNTCQYGGCHVVVSDGNLDDHSIDFCMGLVRKEIELLESLKLIPEKERELIWKLARKLNQRGMTLI